MLQPFVRSSRAVRSKSSANAALMASHLRRVAQQRDKQAFRELFETFGPRVKALLMRQGADVTMAEDIAQETLLTVWRKAHLFAEDKGSVSTWIFTIARNLRIDRLRRQVVWQQWSEENYEGECDDPLPDELVSRRQESEQIARVLATLPEEQVAVVRLSYVDGLSHLEIADQLKLPLGTVKSRMRLAYQKVRSALEGLR